MEDTQKKALVDIHADIHHIHSIDMLDSLLKDQTNKHNIIWASDTYLDKGEQFASDQEIKPELLTGMDSIAIQPRAIKAQATQDERTRQHAEVFTPLWICRLMNNETDTGWFYQKNPHPFDSPEPIVFRKEKKWQRYVDARRMEITCGEAPYLVSRYDVTSGEILPLAERIGLLDRKLRVVNENTTAKEDWLKWARRAFQSIYGYEFQGDNLLIARVNVFMTYHEYNITTPRNTAKNHADSPLLSLLDMIKKGKKTWITYTLLANNIHKKTGKTRHSEENLNAFCSYQILLIAASKSSMLMCVYTLSVSDIAPACPTIFLMKVGLISFAVIIEMHV